MKAGDSKLCPSCGLKNKPKWEFCARCGESLQDVAVGASGAPESAPEGSADAAASEPSEWLTWVGVAVAMLLSLVILIRWRPSPASADPAIFVSPRAEVTERPVTLAPGDSSPLVADGLQDGQAALFTGDVKSALAALSRAVSNAPNDPTAHYTYAQALWASGDREAALDHYRRAVSLSPETVNYRRDLAKVLVSQGRGAEAIPEYEAALRIQPQSPAYLKELAALYVQSGNVAGAVELLSRAVELKVGDPQLLQDLGQALERSGNVAGAADVYRRLVAADPRDGTARALLSELVFREGRQEEAIALVREGIAAGAPVSLYRALASLLERNGRIQEAAENYRAYAERAAGAPDAAAMADRARILEQSGRP